MIICRTDEEEINMIAWKNLDTLATYQKLQTAKRVNLPEAMSGESGAERVKRYSVPMAREWPFIMVQERWMTPSCPPWVNLPRRRN